MDEQNYRANVRDEQLQYSLINVFQALLAFEALK